MVETIQYFDCKYEPKIPNFVLWILFLIERLIESKKKYPRHQ